MQGKYESLRRTKSPLSTPPGLKSVECDKMADTFVQLNPEYCYAVLNNSTYYAKEGFTLINYGELRILALKKCSKSKMTNDQLKQKCFMWVYDTKSKKNEEERRNLLMPKFKEKFAGYNVWIAVSQDQFPYSIRNEKALCLFQKAQYGHNILVVLS